MTAPNTRASISSKILRIAASLLCALVVGTLLGQTGFSQVADGNLVGNVLDMTGAGIPGAMVEAENMATHVKSTTTADETGFYRFNNLLVGRYNVTASLSGFRPATISQVAVELSKTTTANVILGVGGITTEVQVTESPVLIDTTTPHIANTYTSQMAADLPLAANPIGGGIANLSLMGAGVASSGGLGVGTGPSIGGQRPRNNNFTVEGADNNRKDVTGPIIEVPVDAVSEFSVLQNQFSAEFGHSSGGQFNTVLRGGSNEVHGVAYEYFQNRKLNALNQSFKRQGIFEKQRFDQSIVGGAIGGPIVKNRLFYYGNYDYNPVGQASTAAAATFAPTTAGYALLETVPGVSRTNLDILKKYLDPAPTQARTTSVRGIQVPIGILPIVGPNFQNTYRWLVSSDYNMSPRDQLRGRYIDNKISTINTDANLPTFWVTRPITSHLASISEFHTFNPSMTNEVRASYTRYNADFPLPPGLQFPGLDVFPNIQIQNDLALQLGPATNAPQATIQNTYQLVDNVGWIKDKHEVKFGADFRDLISGSTFIQRIRGDYNYSTLERYVLDLPPDLLAQRNVGGKPYIGNNYSLYFYGNDTWKVTRNLTLNLGLRYEYTTVSRSMKEFELNKLADVPGVLTFFAPKPQKKNFGPRVGFAYTPGTAASTTIRGGFGLAYDQIFDNVGSNARPPQATSTFDSPLGGDTQGYLANGGIRPTTQTTGLTPAQARAQTSSWLPDQQLGYSINWNLGVQRVFARDYTVEARYLGTRGIHLIFQTQLNRAAIVTAERNLPTFLQAPSQATLDALTLTLAQLNTLRDTPGIGNTMAQFGFTSNITAYVPRGNSEYHGLALEVNKRFSGHTLLKAAYTWSHLMDDSTAEVNSTTLSPRRPEDFNNIRKEWASSLLDRRHRFAFTWLYTVPWFEMSSNAALKQILGNWHFSGTYIFESPQYATPQSAADSNLNSDAAADRVIINVNGDKNKSSDVTPILRGTQTIAYQAVDPTAYYIRARAGAYATSGRNTLRTNPINNFDISIAKIISLGERYRVEIRGDLYNALNHPQYTPGRINRVNLTSRANVTNYLTPGNPLFAKYDEVWSSNPREVQLTAKFRF